MVKKPGINTKFKTPIINRKSIENGNEMDSEFRVREGMGTRADGQEIKNRVIFF